MPFSVILVKACSLCVHACLGLGCPYACWWCMLVLRQCVRRRNVGGGKGGGGWERGMREGESERPIEGGKKVRNKSPSKGHHPLPPTHTPGIAPLDRQTSSVVQVCKTIYYLISWFTRTVCLAVSSSSVYLAGLVLPARPLFPYRKDHTWRHHRYRSNMTTFDNT